MSWFDKCVTRIYTEIFVEIPNIMNDVQATSIFWSKWVDKVWDENGAYAINLNYYMKVTDINQKIFVIWGSNFINWTWTDFYYEDLPPECECGIFVLYKVCYYFY